MKYLILLHEMQEIQGLANAPPQQEKVWAPCYLNQILFDYCVYW